MTSQLKFHHTALKFKRINQAVKFFIEVLEFKEISNFVTKKGKKVVNLEKNGFILEIFETYSDIEKGGFLKHLAFQVDDINKAAQELKDQGVEFVEEVVSSQDEDGKVFHFAYFLGPESIKLELHQEG